MGLDIIINKRPTRPRPSEVAIGNLFVNPFNQSDWSTVGPNYYTFGTNIGISGGQTANPYTNYIYLYNYPSLLQKQSITITFTVNALTSDGTNDGFWFGFQSISQIARGSLFVKFDGGTGANKGKVTLLYNLTGTISSLSTDSAMDVSNGDSIQITLDINKDIVTVTKKNITQGLFPSALTYTTSLYDNSANKGIQNLSCPAIGAINCDITVTNYSWDSTQNKNVDTVCVGDSITQGAYAGASGQSFADLLGFETLAGASGTTEDIKKALWQIKLVNPQTVILGIGYNDVGYSIPTATWQDNYKWIVQKLIEAGITVKLNTQIPNGNEPTWAQFVRNTYSSSIVYDTYTDLESDNDIFTAFETGSHPNQQGSQAMYYRIKYPTISKFTCRYLAMMTGIQTAATVSAYDTFIKQCITDGNWVLDRAYVFAQPSESNALLSLALPTTTQATKVNSPAWAANGGYTSNGTSSHIDSQYSSATNGVNFTQNSACFGVYIRTSVAAGTKQAMGAITSGGSISNLYPFFSDGFHGKCNTAAASTFANALVADSTGLFMVERTASNLTTVYRNGVAIDTDASVSNSLSTCRFGICAAFSGTNTPSQWFDGQIAAAFMGGALTDHAKFYTAWQTLATTLGFNI